MASSPDGFIREDPWRIFRIMAEFVDSFETLSHLGPAVTIFGSARTPPSDPYYRATVTLARSTGAAVSEWRGVARLIAWLRRVIVLLYSREDDPCRSTIGHALARAYFITFTPNGSRRLAMH